MSIQFDDLVSRRPTPNAVDGRRAFEDAVSLFDPKASEDELWKAFVDELSRAFGIDHVLYGFTHSRLRARHAGVTRSLEFRHNYPADYVAAVGGEDFLDDDVCTTAIMESEAPLLWSDVSAEQPPEVLRRIEIDEAAGITVGASFALRFADGRGAGGVGVCSRSMSEAEFARLWHAERRTLAILVGAFDAVMRDRMVERLYRLTPRERDVLAFTACGFTAKEIAFRLDLASKSVSNVLERARRSMRAGSTTEAVVKAHVHGLI